MARQGKGILDGPRGSLANVTGYKSNGQSILKTKNKKSVKTQTPALIKSQENFKLCMELYKALKASVWGPYLNYSLPGKSLMNHIISLNDILNKDENLVLHDANLFGKKDFRSKFELINNTTVEPYSIQLRTFNTPLTPDADRRDRFFRVSFTTIAPGFNISNTLNAFRGTGPSYTFSSTFWSMTPGRYWTFVAFFSNDLTKIFQQAFIKTIIP